MFVSRRVTKMLVAASLTALLALSLCASASAVYQGTKDTYLNGDLGTLHLVATVDLTGGWYTYSYNLTFETAGSSNEVHYFGVGNPNNELFQDAAHSIIGWGDTGQDPQWFLNENTIEWADGTLQATYTANFSYRSTAAPNWYVNVNAYAADYDYYSSGETVGMGSAVPEPASFAGLAMAIAGVAPFIRRKR